MSDINKAREEIRAVDGEMAKLFERRMEAAREVAEYKMERGLPVFDEAQEKRVLSRYSELITDDDIRSLYLRFMRGILDISKDLQYQIMEGLKVAYSGVEGAFAHIAVTRIFPGARYIPYPNFEAAYNAAASGECDCAVLPVENSYAGEVGPVVDLMFAGDLFVNGAYELNITQNLLGIKGASLSGIKEVVSHPQALAQCAKYIEAHGFGIREAANTAVAAAEVAEAGDESIAAIASAETAGLYGLEVLDHDINESEVNSTRFFVFSRVKAGGRAPEQEGKFILLFTVKHEAGALARAINVIGKYNFNMKVLRSRPMKEQPWQYYFYVEVEGDEASPIGELMIKELKDHCDMLKVAGHYGASISIKKGRL